MYDMKKERKPNRTRTLQTRRVARKDRLAADDLAARIRVSLNAADAAGLLAGKKTRPVSVRLPVKLVAEAKRRTGMTSMTRLIEAALADFAAGDRFGQVMLRLWGTVDEDIELEL